MSAGGLSAEELGAVLDELRSSLSQAQVRDVARLSHNDDLLLFFDTEDGRRAVQIAPGGPRARLCTTEQRFKAADLTSTAQVERLRRRLVETRLTAAQHTAGERYCLLEFGGAQQASLAIELFGPRGLWCLLDADGLILELSRLPRTGQRELRPGVPYSPPPRRGSPPAGSARFAPPVCKNVDHHFTALDQLEQLERERKRLSTALTRAHRKTTQRIAGLERQQEQIAATSELRRKADLLLAYATRAQRGDTELIVPDPEREGQEIRLELEPSVPVQAQAQKLYRRARKLDDAAAISAERLHDARATLASLDGWVVRLDETADSDLAALARELISAGLLPAPARPRPKERKITGGENFRRFESAEGYPIFVGRNNRQNDRLTTRVARGNDLWLHIGQGQTGSHVVVRLPRGKTASLETLLDAATLAVHFSRSRGNPRCEVVYTQAKHVRKPKGLPAGSVVPSQTRTVTIRHDDDRLGRLLDSSR